MSLVRFLLTLCSTMMTNWMATESEVKKQLSESQVCVIVEPDDITTKHISVGIITWSIYKLWYAPVKQDTIFTCLISKIILYVQQFSTWWRTWLNESCFPRMRMLVHCNITIQLHNINWQVGLGNSTADFLKRYYFFELNVKFLLNYCCSASKYQLIRH